jgi:hypothetical protein
MDAFLQEQGFAIIAAVVIFILTLILGAFLRPVFEAAGQKLLARWRGLTSDFPRRYRTYLLDDYQVMNVRGRKTRSPVSLELERVYVFLRARPPDLNAATGRRGQSESLGIGRAMGQHQRLVIIGGPGSGKTTLLIYLLLTYARKLARDRLELDEDRLPLFIPLRQLKTVLGRERGANLPQFLNDYYARLGLAPPAGFFESRLKAGQCLVLLDGLDEVADQTERVQMAGWVDQQVSIYPRNRFIVTSRPAGYDTAALENGFTRLEVQDFSQADIEQFCRNWCLAVELAGPGAAENGGRAEAARRRAETAGADLIQAIGRNSDVQALAVNPLLLSIIALVHRYRATLPRRRVELYAECVDVLLGKWDAAKGLAGELTESQKRAVLQPLALYMHRQKTRELDTQTLLAQLKLHLPAVKETVSRAEVEEFLAEVRDRSGLLLEQGLNSYTFSHQTFQEYLVARELADNGPEDPLLQGVGDEWWREVTLLYTGLKDATPVVQALLEADDQDSHAPLLLAGRCLTDAQKIAPSVKGQTQTRLETLFETGHGQPFLEAGQILAELAEEEALARFLRVIATDNEARRNAALWAVEQMLTDEHEGQRKQYQKQLLEAAWGTSITHMKPALLVYQVLFKDEKILWTEDVVPRLRQIVARKQTEISQGLVNMLSDEAVARIAADCLDSLSALVPGKSVYLSRYPVTNAQYRRFLEADGYHDRNWWSETGWQWRQGDRRYEGQKVDRPDYWDDEKWNNPACPVVGVTWYEAEAYCNWLSACTDQTYRLPTEAEWQQAAQGEDKREYPWGNTWQAGLCNTNEAGVGRTTPVGQYSPAGDSPIGCADMSGNVWEWCADWYDKSQTVRVLRGGSWDGCLDGARCAARGGYRPDDGYDIIGFRLVSPI